MYLIEIQLLFEIFWARKDTQDKLEFRRVDPVEHTSSNTCSLHQAQFKGTVTRTFVVMGEI